MLHSGRGLSVWKEPCGLHQASAKCSQSNDQLGHGLCSQLGKRQDMWKKKAAQVLKNIQICCVRLAGRVSSDGQDSPLKWGDELHLWVGPLDSKLQEYDEDQSKGTSHQLFWVLGFIPPASLENLEDLEYTKCFSLAESSPTAQSTSTWFFLCLWCNTHNSHKINTSPCSLE